jgi:hypothetical protein
MKVIVGLCRTEPTANGFRSPRTACPTSYPYPWNRQVADWIVRSVSGSRAKSLGVATSPTSAHMPGKRSITPATHFLMLSPRASLVRIGTSDSVFPDCDIEACCRHARSMTGCRWVLQDLFKSRGQILLDVAVLLSKAAKMILVGWALLAVKPIGGHWHAHVRWRLERRLQIYG